MQLTTVQEITTTYRHIFLSPHLDDAVYSCGGTLGVQVSSGLRPLVISIFTGAPSNTQTLSPLAQQVMNGMGISDSTALMDARKKEDSAALDYLQCDYLWLDYPDAIFRGNPPSYTTLKQVIGGEVHQTDLDLDKQLAQLFLDVQSRLPDATWYAPLGIGRHVDHQVICSAADRLVQHGAKVYFYEDFPYVARQQDALEKRLNELGNAYEFSLVEMSEMLPLRQEAAAIYASQVISNFGSQDTMNRAISEYSHSIRPVETVYLERYWTARTK
ncbi:MAG TPA: PIG-L family deacetylase [Dictyobacter sp.]|nr:PIG-L family deacetylase [Dictyobacter sp.]